MDLVLIAAGVIALALFLYVLLDGFDLGIGCLTLVMRNTEERELAIATVAPVWDGNETWLVLGGAGLFGFFPLAYAALLPALYVPVMVMLFALVFRGVVFEFRAKSTRLRGVWDLAFGIGSLIASVAQGAMLGAFIGGDFDWRSPFALMCGAGLVCGYALLGACWLAFKTEGAMHAWALKAAKRLVPALVLFIALVSLWTPLEHAHIAARWFAWPNLLLLSPVPIATGALVLGLWLALLRERPGRAFWCAIGVFALCYLGLAISLYPHIVPPDMTIWNAAAAPDSLLFLLAGTLVLLPIILAYTAHAYWVFRGKVRAGEGYH
jgi:cytochrome bd ubiquinol oxidase subunit II